MRALAITGFKNSGKTTFTAAVAAALQALHVRVGAVKFSHHTLDVAADLPHAPDTATLLNTCDAVVGLSEGVSLAAWPGRRSLDDMLPLLRAQALLVEGGKTMTRLPRLILPRWGHVVEDIRALAPELALGVVIPSDLDADERNAVEDALTGGSGEFGASLPRVATPEAAAELVMTRGFLLPGLDCGACGREDCRALALEIVAGAAQAGDCAAYPEALEIDCGGTPLPLNPFTANLVSNVLHGVLDSLKGCGDGPVTIRLHPKTLRKG